MHTVYNLFIQGPRYILNTIFKDFQPRDNDNISISNLPKDDFTFDFTFKYFQK